MKRLGLGDIYPILERTEPRNIVLHKTYLLDSESYKLKVEEFLKGALMLLEGLGLTALCCSVTRYRYF